MNFINNYAIYGGAVYVEASQTVCYFKKYKSHAIRFSGNTAIVGDSIFFASNECNSTRLCDDDKYVTSLPYSASSMIDNSSVFPGQKIIIDNMMLIDCFNKNTTCIADVQFMTEDCCNGVRLQGLPQAVIHSGVVSLNMKITSKVNRPNSPCKLCIHPKLQFVCKSPTSDAIATKLTMNLTLLSCPIGFTFNEAAQQCQCCSNLGIEKAFVCSDIGKACIRKGYWFGNVSGIITVSKCSYLYCNYNSTEHEPCGITSSDTTDYVLLSHSQHDQCQYGHGGTLCTGCTNGMTATHSLLQCINIHQCKSWHPYALLVLNIICPFLMAMLLIIIIQLKLSVGSGYLYGPLFYLAVLNLLPLSTLGKFSSIVHYYTATFVLKLEVLGFIPWCFFPSVNPLYAKYFDLVAPLVVSIVLLLTVYLARCVPRLFQYFQKSPMQGICVLIMISFWSLASTSIQVITPVYLPGLNETRVNLQPDLLYLHGQHIVLWIISVIILLFLLCLMIVLILSPFVHFITCSLRIKPILDEFQSCYRDNIRWYGGVYFCCWILLQVVIITSNCLIVSTLIIIFTVTHCLIQPYSQKWLNIMDGVLLGCLSITSSLLTYDNNHGNSRKVMIYMFTLLPLAFITVGVIWVILIRLGVSPIVINVSKRVNNSIKHLISKRLHQFKAQQPAQHNAVKFPSPVEAITDREPLIYYLQQESADYGTIDQTFQNR